MASQLSHQEGFATVLEELIALRQTNEAKAGYDVVLRELLASKEQGAKLLAAEKEVELLREGELKRKQEREEFFVEINKQRDEAREQREDAREQRKDARQAQLRQESLVKDLLEQQKLVMNQLMERKPLQMLIQNSALVRRNL